MSLMEQIRGVVRAKRYSLRTEQAYTYWVRRYLRFHRREDMRGSEGRSEGGWVHPRDLGAEDVEAFLTHLAVQENVAEATQNQAVNALVFLYK